MGFFREIRGSALWDGIKWLWSKNAGGAFLVTVAQSVYAWLTGHPNTVSLLIGLAACVVFVVASVFGRRGQAASEPQNYDQKEKTINTSIAQQPSLMGPPPAIRVEYASGKVGKLTLKNDSRTPAIVRHIGKLVSEERYVSEYELNIVPQTPPPIEFGSPVECSVHGVTGPIIGNIAVIGSLEETLKGGSAETSNHVVIDFDDMEGNGFSRVFSLKRNQDDSVSWIPDTVVPKGSATAPRPGVKALAVLRQHLLLAENFPIKSREAVLCAANLDEEKSRSRRLEARLAVWPKVCEFNGLAAQAIRVGALLLDIKESWSHPFSAPCLEAINSPLSEIKGFSEPELRGVPLGCQFSKFRFQQDIRALRDRIPRESGLQITNLRIPSAESFASVEEIIQGTIDGLHAQAARLLADTSI